MSAKKFYEQMRQKGLTEDITSNDSPDYNLSFYQSIFRLMEDFSKKEYEEKLRWISLEEKLPTIGVIPYQVECKSKMNGQIETYWIEYDSQYLISVCSHWRLIL